MTPFTLKEKIGLVVCGILAAFLVFCLVMAVVTAPRLHCPQGTTQTDAGCLNSKGEPVAEGKPDK